MSSRESRIKKDITFNRLVSSIVGVFSDSVLLEEPTEEYAHFMASLYECKLNKIGQGINLTVIDTEDSEEFHYFGDNRFIYTTIKDLIFGVN